MGRPTFFDTILRIYMCKKIRRDDLKHILKARELERPTTKSTNN